MRAPASAFLPSHRPSAQDLAARQVKDLAFAHSALDHRQTLKDASGGGDAFPGGAVER